MRLAVPRSTHGRYSLYMDAYACCIDRSSVQRYRPRLRPERTRCLIFGMRAMKAFNEP